MGNLSVSVPHRLPRSVALERVKRLLGQLKNEQADNISGLRESWNGYVGTFAFSARGFDVSGTVNVTDRNVIVDGKLPFLASMFKGQIEQVIRDRAEALLRERDVPMTAPTVGANTNTQIGAKAPGGGPAMGNDTQRGKSGEFCSFAEVCERLQIDETRLKRLVSDGEIRAFRGEGNPPMKFRRADVEGLDLTGARGEEETGIIDLSAGGGDCETLTGDLIFDEGDDLDLTDGSDAVPGSLGGRDRVEEGVALSAVRDTTPAAPASREPNEYAASRDADLMEDDPSSDTRKDYAKNIAFVVLVLGICLLVALSFLEKK